MSIRMILSRKIGHRILISLAFLSCFSMYTDLQAGKKKEKKALKEARKIEAKNAKVKKIAPDQAIVKKLDIKSQAIASWLALAGQNIVIFNKNIMNGINEKLYPDLAKFVTKYRCPKDVEKLILQQLSFKDKLVGRFHNLPFFVIKGMEFDRIINADRMMHCIELNNLDRLTVAQKYLYCDGNYWGVAALKADIFDCALNLTLQEVQQMFVFVTETGYKDLKFDLTPKYNEYRNFFYDKQGRIVCVDTENLSFEVSGHSHSWGYTYVPFYCKANYAMSLLHYANCMSKPVAKWLENQVNFMLSHDDSFKEFMALPFNTKYDNSGINMDKVEADLSRFMSAKK